MIGRLRQNWTDRDNERALSYEPAPAMKESKGMVDRDKVLAVLHKRFAEGIPGFREARSCVSTRRFIATFPRFAMILLKKLLVATDFGDASGRSSSNSQRGRP